MLRFAKFLNINLSLLDSPRSTGKSMFDSADVEFRIVNGKAILDPIKFTGGAFSLQGKRHARPPGEPRPAAQGPLRPRPVPPAVVSDVVREASGQFFIVRVVGPSSSPKPELVPLPPVTKMRLRRGERAE